MDPIFIFFLVMLVFLYLLLIRPQRQQQKRVQEMLHNLQVGDEVITAGGIYGEVTAIDDERVQLEIDADVRIAVSRRAITNRLTPEESAQMDEEPEDAEPETAQMTEEPEDAEPETAQMTEEPEEAPEPDTLEESEPAAEEQKTSR